MSADTLWGNDASEARHETARIAREEPWQADVDKPTRTELALDKPGQRDPARPAAADPWQTESLRCGDRVYHRLNTDAGVRHKGSGAVAASLGIGTDLEYLIQYDNGGHGWHPAADIRRAGADDDPF